MFNFKKNESYATIAFYAVAVIVASALMIYAVINMGTVWGAIEYVLSVLSPFIYGFIFAYLCNPILNFYEKKVFSFKRSAKDRFVLRRTLGIICTTITALAILAILAYAVIPQTIKSINDFGTQFTVYVDKVLDFADKLTVDYLSPMFNESYTTFPEFLAAHDISVNVKDMLFGSFDLFRSSFTEILNYGTKFVGELINILMGIILAIYFLISKEKLSAQVKKILASVLSRRRYLNTVRLARFTHRTFGGFIVGKLIDSAIIGVLSLIVLAILDISYYPLLSVIIGITNFIPTFGPIIGGVIGGLLVLIASPQDLLVFIIVVVLIQQFDGNILGPHILGDSIGISALWVVVSVILASGFFGFTGMVFGVPTIAVIYALVKQGTERRLIKKNMPKSTEFYRSDPPIEDKIDPCNIFIDKETPIPEITAEDDLSVPKECAEKKKESLGIKIKSTINKMKGKNKK